MSNQPEALRLAEVSPYLEGGERGQWIIAAAAELRRLSKVEAQRDALLAVLKDIAGTDPVDAALDPQRAVRIARAAIKAVEGENT